MFKELSIDLCQEPGESILCSKYPASLQNILILSSHWCLCLPHGHFHSGFQIKILYLFLISSMHDTFPIPSHFPVHHHNIWHSPSIINYSYSILLLVGPDMPSVSCSQIFQISVLLLWQQTKFKIHAKQKEGLTLYNLTFMFIWELVRQMVLKQISASISRI